MLRYKLTHPEVLMALAGAGHGSTVLIADGNYPLSTGSSPSARRVYLNLTPGIPLATDVLAVLVDAIPIEAARVMAPEGGHEPEVYAEFRSLLPAGLAPGTLGRFEFYEAAQQPDLALAIATGEQRLYANILLTIGVLSPA